MNGSGNGSGNRDGSEFDIKKLKKGHTVVVPNPRRHGVREGKQGYVRCTWGDLVVSNFLSPCTSWGIVSGSDEGEQIIPTSLGKLLDMSERYIKAQENIEANSQEILVACQSCERKANEEELSRCTGCSKVYYCGKVCVFI